MTTEEALIELLQLTREQNALLRMVVAPPQPAKRNEPSGVELYMIRKEAANALAEARAKKAEKQRRKAA